MRTKKDLTDLNIDNYEDDEIEVDNTREEEQNSNSYMNDYLDDDGLYDDYGGDITPMEKHSELLKQLTDFEPFLKDMVTEWMGLIWSEDEQKYISPKNIEPIMNIQGARWCVGFLRTYTRGNNIITQLGQEEYNNLMLDIIDTAILNIGTKTEQFGIHNNGDCIKIWNQLIHASSLILIGAGSNNNYKDMFKDTYKHSDNSGFNNVPNPQQQPNMFERARTRLFGKQ